MWTVIETFSHLLVEVEVLQKLEIVDARPFTGIMQALSLQFTPVKFAVNSVIRDWEIPQDAKAVHRETMTAEFASGMQKRRLTFHPGLKIKQMGGILSECFNSS